MSVWKYSKRLYGGNVCVRHDCQGQSFGYLIIKLAEYYLFKNRKVGFLLCKNTLIHFYIKCGWIKFSGNIYNKFGDLLKCNLFATESIEKQFLVIERNF